MLDFQSHNVRSSINIFSLNISDNENTSINFEEIEDFDFDFDFDDDTNEPSIPEQQKEDSTNILNIDKNKGKTTSAVWEYMYKKYDDTNKVVAIICNLCKKEYSSKTLMRLLMDHISKEHKRNISIKQQTQLHFVKNPYGKFDAIRVKDCTNATIDFVVGSQMPFSIVESSWFKKLCNVLAILTSNNKPEVGSTQKLNW